MAPTRSRGKFARAVLGGARTFAKAVGGGALNLRGRYQRAKAVVVRSGPSDAFATPFVMSRETRRTLFLQELQEKKESVEKSEHMLLLALELNRLYGPRGIIKERIYHRMKHYPTFRPYYEKKLAQLQAIPPTLKEKPRMLEFVDAMNAELDAWTFTPDVVEEGMEV
jgi:hypothetical protein